MNRVEQLALKLIDGDCTDREIAELEVLLVNDPHAYSQFLAVYRVEAALRGQGRPIDAAREVMSRLREVFGHDLESSSRLDELTGKLLDEGLTPAELDELNQLVQADQRNRQRHLELRELEVQLRGVAPIDVTDRVMNEIAARGPTSQLQDTPPDRDAPTVEVSQFSGISTASSLPRNGRRSRYRRKKRFPWMSLAIAASLLAAAFFAYDHWRNSNRPVEPFELAASLAQADDDVIVRRHATNVAAQRNLELHSGDQVIVPPGAAATVRYSDGTQVTFGSGTEVIVQPADQGSEYAGAKQLALNKGRLVAHVAPQSNPFVISTGTGVAQVLGTRLVASLEDSRTRLDVIDGKVRFQRPQDQQAIEVAGGQFAVAARDKALVAQPLPPRVNEALVMLYRFDEGSGAIVHDQSRSGPPLDLTIAEPSNAHWLPGGGLEVVKSTLIASNTAPDKLTAACQSSGELTIEAWVRPTRASQTGPARIVTCSKDTNYRNFTLGHGGEHGCDPEDRENYVVRLRTRDSDVQGMPETRTPRHTVHEELLHLVVTRNIAGELVIYVDGLDRARSDRGGDFSTWNDSYLFALANEFTRDRPWLGEYHLVALYSRALSTEEVMTNFRVGPRGR